jgi:hypothetical protein
MPGVTHPIRNSMNQKHIISAGAPAFPHRGPLRAPSPGGGLYLFTLRYEGQSAKKLGCGLYLQPAKN